MPADHNFTEEIRRWLSNKPREVVVVFAARAALRIAPFLKDALKPRSGGAAHPVLPAFRALATSWIAGQYPTYGGVRVAAPIIDRISLDGLTPAAAAAATAASSAAFSALSAFAEASTTSTASVSSAVAAIAAIINTETIAATAADQQIIDHGESTLALAVLPLWLPGRPDWARDDWHKLEQALLKEDRDWHVWTDWYRARLEGKPPNETLEVARVLISDRVWKRGPRAVNAEIARLIKKHGAHGPPKPLADVPSVLGFAWTPAGTMTAVPSRTNWPVFPRLASEKDHRDRLETCRTLAQDIISALMARKYQVRAEYAEGLAKYTSRLPEGPAQGIFLLADAEARTLRNLFAAEADALPYGFAAQLKTFLEQHIGLRAFYPEIEKFYRDVQAGRVETPLPQDAVAGFIDGVKRYSPNVFDASVGNAIAGTTQPPPVIAPPHPAEPSHATPHQPMPPSDPLKELDPKKAHDFTFAGMVNALWKTFLEGEKIPKAADGWHKAGDTLQPFVTQILEWLRNFMGL